MAAEIQSDEQYWAREPIEGELYKFVLGRFHDVLAPKTYLEIGVLDGATFALAKCKSIAIDPNLSNIRSSFNNKPSSFLFQSTSDEFFKSYDAKQLLGQSVDMAFLDGMHWYEFLLRDFMNVEKACKRNSVIFLHDCCPVNSYVGRRDVSSDRFLAQTSFEGWWAGDVWKAVAILLKYRKDLKIRAFDAHPTGLIAITNLNNGSCVLDDHYFDFVAEVRDWTLSERGNEYFSNLNLLNTSAVNSASKIAHEFWL